MLPRLKRVVVLLHKIGEGLHSAQGSDHPGNTVGSKLISSFLNKLATNLQPGAERSGGPATDKIVDTVMAEAPEEETEEVCWTFPPRLL